MPENVVETHIPRFILVEKKRPSHPANGTYAMILSVCSYLLIRRRADLGQLPRRKAFPDGRLPLVASRRREFTRSCNPRKDRNGVDLFATLVRDLDMIVDEPLSKTRFARSDRHVLYVSSPQRGSAAMATGSGPALHRPPCSQHSVSLGISASPERGPMLEIVRPGMTQVQGKATQP